MYLWGVARVCCAPDWLQQGAKSTHLNKSVLGVALGEHSEAPRGAVAWLCAPVFRGQPWHHWCARTSVESRRQDGRQPVSPWPAAQFGVHTAEQVLRPHLGGHREKGRRRAAKPKMCLPSVPAAFGSGPWEAQREPWAKVFAEEKPRP